VEPAADAAASPDVRCGDPATVFAELFDAHAAGLHRYLSRRVGAVADDLVAETFLASRLGDADGRVFGTLSVGSAAAKEVVDLAFAD